MKREEYVIVTPEIAQKLLETNKKNRKLSVKTVNVYAYDMRTGAWNDNNEDPIVINKFNIMENGQHRLYAVIKSGVPTKFKVITGSEPAAETYDRGRPRRTNDSLIMKGTVDTKSLNEKISIVRLLARFGYSIGKLSDSQIEKYILQYDYELWRAIRLVSSGKTVGIARKKEVYLATYCALRSSIPENQLYDFFNVVNSGFMDYKWQSSAIVLRNLIVEGNPTIIPGHGKGYSEHLLLVAEYAIRDYVKMTPRTRKYTINENSQSVFLKSIAEKDKAFFVEED